VSPGASLVMRAGGGRAKINGEVAFPGAKGGGQEGSGWDTVQCAVSCLLTGGFGSRDWRAVWPVGTLIKVRGGGLDDLGVRVLPQEVGGHSHEHVLQQGLGPQ
jgi:hypothetical protein